MSKPFEFFEPEAFVGLYWSADPSICPHAEVAELFREEANRLLNERGERIDINDGPEEALIICKRPIEREPLCPLENIHGRLRGEMGFKFCTECGKDLR